MTFSIALSNPSLSPISSSPLPHATVSRRPRRFPPLIRALTESQPESKPESNTSKPNLAETNIQPSASTSTATATPQRPQKPVYYMKKGQIVRVDKDKYLNSINYLSVDHPPYYKGLEYIYEDCAEVLDLRNFDTGEYALIAWVGVPTAPAWLPTEMLIKSDKLDYERM